MDLTTHLREAVRNGLPVAKAVILDNTNETVEMEVNDGNNGKESQESKEHSDHDRLGIAQSALMCLDILSKYLGSSPNWTVTLSETLAEVVQFSSQVSTCIESTDKLRISQPSSLSSSSSSLTQTPSKSTTTTTTTTLTPKELKKKNKKELKEKLNSTSDLESGPDSGTGSGPRSVTLSEITAAKSCYPELLKLQGSVFLSSGTMCGVVGPRALPYLGVRVILLLLSLLSLSLFSIIVLLIFSVFFISLLV